MADNGKQRVRFEDVIAGFALILMLGLVIMEITLRNFFNISFLWSEEVARYLMIWSVYFGAASAIKTGDHLRIEMLIDHVPPRVRRYFDVFAQLWIVAFSLAITYAGYHLVRDSFFYGFTSADSNLDVGMGWIQLVIPVTFALSAIHALTNALALVRGFRMPAQATQEHPAQKHPAQEF